MRPLLIGMNNPLSLRPGHELYPAPEGCTGHRLWRLLHERTGASRLQYTQAFERRNLVRGVSYNRQAARLSAVRITKELEGSGRTVVLLGRDVQAAFDYALLGQLPPLLLHPQRAGGCTWRQIPHPSGRNRYYNDEKNRHVVSLLMEELYREALRNGLQD